MKEKTRENLNTMIEEMKEKLKIVNSDALKADQFPLENFDHIEELHSIVMKKSSFSLSEMDAIVTELGNLRNE